MPPRVYELLQYFCGELTPYKQSKNKKRMFLNEFSAEDQNLILNWFTENKTLVLNDIIRGRGRFAAEWVMVVQFKNGKFKNWCIANVNQVVQFMGEGDVKLSSRGSLLIGRILMQRKGGDNGRETAKCLQFKENPMEILRAFGGDEV